jgi:UDP-N-acetylglucosamine/UDP-N-acetylgalactosamine diphosphorylase
MCCILNTRYRLELNWMFNSFALVLAQVFVGFSAINGDNVFVDSEFLNSPTVQRQKSALESPYQPLEVTPYQNATASVSSSDIELGRKLLDSGQVGCILIAGGHGSRLGYDEPKGTFPLSVIRNKSLFQLFAEKVVAASRQAGHMLPLAVMTAPDNHLATEMHFASHQAFGLEDNQLALFQQGQLPFLDNEGAAVWNADGSIVCGPAGNGWCLRHFYEQGLWQQWHAAGIRYVTFIMVDNPLADPFDAALIGYHAQHGGDVTIKSTLRNDVNEKVGLIAMHNGIPVVVEYSDLPPAMGTAQADDGGLFYRYANLSLFCFSMDFIKRCHDENVWDKMPFHPVRKKIPSTGCTAWKFEYYIFDVLPWARKTQVLLYPRELCFAPLKEREGPCGVKAVQEALLAADRRAYHAVTGILPSESACFELSQDFHYPTPELLKLWHGRELPSTGYIQP